MIDDSRYPISRISSKAPKDLFQVYYSANFQMAAERSSHRKYSEIFAYTHIDEKQLLCYKLQKIIITQATGTDAFLSSFQSRF